MVEEGKATGVRFNARNVLHVFVKCRTIMKKQYVSMRIKIRNIYGALKKQDIEEVVHSAQEYVDLLDHEAIHGKESGSYHGAEGDVTKIRSALSKIEKEKDVK